MHDKLRLVFRRGQNVRYISHLDLLRTFTRAMRRSGLPVKYSEGFNPHPQMTFALPLSVGVLSECEIVDISLARDIDLIEELKNLAVQLPKGLEIVEGYRTLTKMSEIKTAEYMLKVELEQPCIREKVIEAVTGFELMAEKVTKKKTEMVNVLLHLHKFEANEEMREIKMEVSAGNTFNLKPELVLEAISNKVSEFKIVDCDVTRTRFGY